MTALDASRLQMSWDLVAQHGDQVPLFFYSTLFVTHPHTRDMFPLSMEGQRDKLVTALGRVVSHVDHMAAVTPILEQLGRDHRHPEEGRKGQHADRLQRLQHAGADPLLVTLDARERGERDLVDDRHDLVDRHGGQRERHRVDAASGHRGP